MTIKMPPALNRATTERLLDLGHEMQWVRKQWWIDGRPIHGNAARVILAQGVKARTLVSLGNQRWKRKPKEALTYCEQIAEHITNNNIPEALDMLQKLDAEIARLTFTTPPIETR